ncbi:MAG: hypothetical protein ACRDU9_08950, partial [Acidimicrobiia bacterium]
MELGRGRSRSAIAPVLYGVGFLVLLGLGVLAGLLLGDDSAGSSPPGTEAAPPTSPDATTAPASGDDDVTQPTEGAVDPSCELPPGEPFVGGPQVEMTPIGEVNGHRVEAAVYPHPDYPAELWSQWGQGIALADGRFISAIGDHMGVDGNSFIYEYDPDAGTLSMVGDVLSYIDHTPGSWGYGKIHAQMVPGSCGEVYFSTYWGTSNDLRYGGSYSGDYLFRLDPDGRTMTRLDVPVELHGTPSLASSPEHGLVYGEAIDPASQDADIDDGPFYVYDTSSEEVVFTGDPLVHSGFRNILVDAEGRAYYSIGGGKLAVYEPGANQVTTLEASMPGDWLRASTFPAPDGRVFAVTRDPDAFFVLHPSGEIEPLGIPTAYVASMAVHPSGDRFFYLPDAHGDAWQFGGALTAVDTTTGEQ